MITFEPVDSPERAEDLRVLRNECAEWMTWDTSLITAERQQEFYRQKITTGKIEGFLMLADAVPVADEQPVSHRHRIGEHQETFDLPGGDLLPVKLLLPFRRDQAGVPGHPFGAFIAQHPQVLGPFGAVNRLERDHPAASQKPVTAVATRPRSSLLSPQ